MKKIRKFEDIESWRYARKLTNEIYKVTSGGGFVRDFGLKDLTEIGELLAGFIRYLNQSTLRGNRYR